MRAALAAVLCLGMVLVLSPAIAQPAAGPLPPDSQAHTRLTTSLIELLLTLHLGAAAAQTDARPVEPQPHLRRHAATAAAQMALAAAP
jgi:hypothetical protein